MDSIKCLHLLGERCQKQQIIQRNDPFDCCLTLLQSISTEDANILKHTREYHDFQNVVERLVSAHRQISQWNESDQMLVGCVEPSDFLMSFLQHTATDDIVNRVFDFLECRDLIHTMRTCSRFRELAERHATERTKNLASGRQLATAMQLLRAQEQIEGVAGMGISDRHVRVPALLLPRRILLTESGDTEYNGVYFCTGSNGNGYVFTKPRSPAQRLVASNQTSHRRLQDDSAVFDEAETEMTQPGQLLRCIIAKRFSGETILWYLSKEVIAEEDHIDIHAGDVKQEFSFWAKLMVLGDASIDTCCYPSQTSILTRHDRADGWKSLSTTRATQPPIVELID